MHDYIASHLCEKFVTIMFLAILWFKKLKMEKHK